MNAYYVLFFMLFLPGSGGGKQSVNTPFFAGPYLTRNPGDLANFKTFVISYFDAVEKGDTTFVKTHTKFPIKDSDFGSYLRPPKKLASISSNYFLGHLKLFFPAKFIAAAKRKGKGSGPSAFTNLYTFAYDEVNASNSDFLDSDAWDFEKKGNEFELVRYRHDVSNN
jgi:hypothetical protein